MRGGFDSEHKAILQNKVTPKINWSIHPIILDSPLASRFTQVYRELKPFWDNEALQRVKAAIRWASSNCSPSIATRPIWRWFVIWLLPPVRSL